MKKTRFYFHYNKPASKKAGAPKLSIHHKGLCYLVDSLICHVSIESKNNKRQPHCVMQGFGQVIRLDNEDSKIRAHIF